MKLVDLETRFMGTDTLKWVKETLNTHNHALKVLFRARELGALTNVPYWKILRFVLTESKKYGRIGSSVNNTEKKRNGGNR